MVGDRSLDERSGMKRDLDEIETMLGARGSALAALLREAAAIRDAGLEAAGRPGIITYSRKVFVPVTTLCRDRCHYCTFVDTPAQLRKLGKPVYMDEDEIIRLAREGAALGCKEALFTLGDRPEDRWPDAREWLDSRGYASTIDYLAAMARRVTAETGMLVHMNPGVMRPDELALLREASPSMGMMLETTSTRLWAEPGQVHYGSPDKEPSVRLRVLQAAGEARIPFTTGLLIGIGETPRDRAESLLALHMLAEEYGHIQEVIIQNFRAKPRTAMRGVPDAEFEEYLAAVATARIVLGAGMRVQVPPNLSDAAECAWLLRAGADDWGGVSPLTPDHVNPERPWPEISALAAITADAGFELRERLTAHPEYVRGDDWIEARLRPAVLALAGPDGLAATSSATEAADTGVESRGRSANSVDPHSAGAFALSPSAAGDARTETTDAEWADLLRSTGADLEALVARADEHRRHLVGDVVTAVVNRNLTTSGYRSGARATDEPGTFTLADAGRIAADAVDLGATELCVQGLLPQSEDPNAYLEIARAVKAAAPRIHLHAYRPQDIDDLATRGGLGLDRALDALIEAGVDTFPGTGVKILDERVRRQVAPGDLPVERWEEIVRAAHARGLRSTSVIFIGHVETAQERIAHLRRLQAIQRDAAAGGHGGFTELVPIPMAGWGVPLVEGRSRLDGRRAMFAVARLMLGSDIRHIQVPWTRVGPDAAATLLQAGADDLGGTLLDGRVRPDAGVEQGLELPLERAEALAARLMRPFRQRTTTYGAVSHAGAVR